MSRYIMPSRDLYKGNRPIKGGTQMKFFVSDLHLGCGDALEDFLLWEEKPCLSAGSRSCLSEGMRKMHKVFSLFIDHIISLGQKESQTPELIFLGDTLDLLQVLPEEREDPRKIDLISEAHQPFFHALDRFHKNGGVVTLVVGNHDHDLLKPALYKALKNHLPFINGKPLLYYYFPEGRVYAEHGNQFDSLNSFKDPFDPAEWPFGSELVLRLVNPLEETHPIIDNLGIREALWFAIRHLPEILSATQRKDLMVSEAIRFLSVENRMKHLAYFIYHQVMPGSDSSVFHLLWRLLCANEKLLRKGDSRKRYAKGLLYTFSRIGRNPVRVFREILVNQQHSAAKKIINGKKDEAIGKPNPSPRFVLFGHTHTPLTSRIAPGCLYINTGSWRMRALPYRRFSLRYSQTLDYAVARQSKKGTWYVRRHSFAGEYHKNL